MPSTEARMGTDVQQRHRWDSISMQISLFHFSKTKIKHLPSKAGHDSMSMTASATFPSTQIWLVT